MAFDFSGRRAVVCGGSRGIGRSIALGLAQAGAAVSICARGAETLEATRGEIAKFGHTAHAGVCDLADGAAIRRYIADAARALGGIDILVNNASGFASTRRRGRLVGQRRGGHDGDRARHPGRAALPQGRPRAAW